MPSRLRVAAGLALLLVSLAVVAIVVQDHTGFLPLGLFNEGERAYRWISLALLAALLLTGAVFAVELAGDRKLAAGALLRRILVSALMLEAIVCAFDTVLARSPHLDVPIGGPYYERANSRGEYVFLRRAHAGSPYGFRALSPADPAPKGKRVLFLGDSYTEGSGHGLECNYPDVVGQALRERLGDGVEAMNAGVGGYGPREAAKLLRLLRDDGFRFDAVVYSIFVENDVTDDLPGTDRRVIAGMNERVPHAWFLRVFHPLNSRTFRYAVVLWRLGTISGSERNAAKRENGACVADEPFPELDDHTIANATRRVRASERALAPGGDAELVSAVRDMEAQAREMGVPLVIVLFPYRILGDAKLRSVFPRREIADSDLPRRMHEHVAAALADLPVIDTLPVIEALAGAYRANDVHLSDAGNVAAGEYVADRLAEILPGLGESSLR
jgi:lysophospholipase L1-like esterase